MGGGVTMMPNQDFMGGGTPTGAAPPAAAAGGGGQSFNAEMYNPLVGLQDRYKKYLDDISKNKFCYIIDMKQIKLLYMNGQRMKKHNPSRPYDRMVQFNGLSTTCVLIAKQLNTSSIVELD